MANVACVYLLQAIAVWKGLELLPLLLLLFLDFVAQEFASTLLDGPHVPQNS